jgi:hypothetical protein
LSVTCGVVSEAERQDTSSPIELEGTTIWMSTSRSMQPPLLELMVPAPLQT